MDVFCSLGPGEQLPEKTPCIGQGIKHEKICMTGHEKTSFTIEKSIRRQLAQDIAHSMRRQLLCGIQQAKKTAWGRAGFFMKVIFGVAKIAT